MVGFPNYFPSKSENRLAKINEKIKVATATEKKLEKDLGTIKLLKANLANEESDFAEHIRFAEKKASKEFLAIYGIQPIINEVNNTYVLDQKPHSEKTALIRKPFVTPAIQEKYETTLEEASVKINNHYGNSQMNLVFWKGQKAKELEKHQPSPKTAPALT